MLLSILHRLPLQSDQRVKPQERLLVKRPGLMTGVQHFDLIVPATTITTKVAEQQTQKETTEDRLSILLSTVPILIKCTSSLSIMWA